MTCLHFRADLAVIPHNAKLHYNFANFLKDIEQQENAIKHYKEALKYVCVFITFNLTIPIFSSSRRPAILKLFYLLPFLVCQCIAG